MIRYVTCRLRAASQNADGELTAVSSVVLAKESVRFIMPYALEAGVVQW